MSAHDHTANEQDVPTEGRYADFETSDELVVYDTENNAAWIASDTTYPVRRCCEHPHDGQSRHHPTTGYDSNQQ